MDIDVPEDLIHTPKTATAESHPCELYKYHAPKVIRTQYHHSKPVYLQNRLYGQIAYGADHWVCGNCHDAIHEWLGYLLGESRRPNPEPGRNIKAEAEATYRWYTDEMWRLHPGRID